MRRTAAACAIFAFALLLSSAHLRYNSFLVLSDQYCVPSESGIVYALSRKDTETIAAALQVNGVKAAAYTSDCTSTRRQEIQVRSTTVGPMLVPVRQMNCPDHSDSTRTLSLNF
jgi:hypothetical protein